MEKHPSQGDQFLALINQTIVDNIDNENFSVEDLARLVGLSRSMLHRRLKKLSGKSASDHITGLRLTKAKELLENDAASVSEIAYRVGFNDPSYFSKVFKKYFGVSPGNIRKNHLSTEQKSNILNLSKLKAKSVFIKAAAITTIIITAGFGIYVIFRMNSPFEKSVAVLPLHNLTGEPENAYFVDGIHDALIGELGQVESLRVISRTSTLRYRESDMLMQDIASELGVNNIVEGSVTGTGDSLKVLIQLIDVFPKERHLLAKEYHDDMHNILNMQSAVAKDIVHKIRVDLSEDEEKLLERSRTVDPEAYKDYLRGLYYLNQGTAESFEAGLKFMMKARDHDPGDPFAYAGIALAYAIKGHGMIASESSFRSATAAAELALRIDPAMDEAYTALALLHLYQFWDWSSAEEAFKNSLSNNPNNAIAHAHYAFYHVLYGERKKALHHAKTAVAIEPFSASYHSWLAWLYYFYEEYDKAELSALKSLQLKDDIPYGNLVLGWTYLKKQQFQEALEIHKKLPKYGDYNKMLLGYTYIQTGNIDKAIAIWNEWEEYSKDNWVNPFHRGLLAGMLGYYDEAFELLNEACENKYYPTNYINIFPGVEFIRDDPRYEMLLQKMNLPINSSFLSAQK